VNFIVILEEHMMNVVYKAAKDLNQFYIVEQVIDFNSNVSKVLTVLN
jgi:hypothetical protein